MSSRNSNDAVMVLDPAAECDVILLQEVQIQMLAGWSSLGD